MTYERREAAVDVHGKPATCTMEAWLPETGTPCAALFYLHGGGLLYGTRDDLPVPYRDAILARGLGFVAVDYPLAPQADAAAVLDAVHTLYGEAERLLPGVRLVPTGRSAGAWLALMLAHRLGQEGRRPPAAIDFYGYCDLAGTMQAALFQPSGHYRRNMGRVTPAVAKRLVGTQLLVEAPLQERYGLYVHARQSGSWGTLLGIDPTNISALSLDPASQAALPPLFIAASADDTDVPFACSQRLAASCPDAATFFVDSGGHDFDRDPSGPHGMAAWTACLDWLVTAL